MKLISRPVAALVPYARNARTHSDAQIAMIVRSIKEFGWTNPVLVDGKNGIIAGHGRVLAAAKLGMKHVPCIELKHLNEAQRRAYVIADNQIALQAGWDDALLRLELADLQALDFNLDLLGFDTDQLAIFLNGSPNFTPGSEDDQGRLDQLTPMPVRCPHCGGEFNGREHAST